MAESMCDTVCADWLASVHFSKRIVYELEKLRKLCTITTSVRHHDRLGDRLCVTAHVDGLGELQIHVGPRFPLVHPTFLVNGELPALTDGTLVMDPRAWTADMRLDASVRLIRDVMST